MNAPTLPRRSPAIRPHGKAHRVESYAAERPPQSKRLTDWEADDLRYLWQGYEADLGVRSAHGMIERHILLMAPPRDVQRPVLEELLRAGGRAPEGRIARLVVLDGLATRCEIRKAIEYLTRVGKKGPRVERIPVPRPEPSNACDGKCDLAIDRKQRACAACEWTGFDLRLTARGELRMGLALASVPVDRDRRRWDAQDDAIRQEWQTMYCRKQHGSGRANEETLAARERKSVNRAVAALSRVSREHALILQCWLGRHYVNENALLDAVRRLETGATRERANEMLDEASDAYRKARKVGQTLRRRKTTAGAKTPRVRILDGDGWKEIG